MACKFHYASCVKNISPPLLEVTLRLRRVNGVLCSINWSYNDNIRRANRLDNRSYVA
jgi:hypothetical protein